MKTCPYCAEEIKDAAIRCRWCQMWLVEDVPAGAEGDRPPAVAAVAAATVTEGAVEEAPMEAPMEEPAPSEPETAKMEPVAAAAGAGTAAAELAAAEEAAPAAAPEAKIEFTHTGTRYLLGYGADYFGIWDRNAPQTAIERFPRNDQGWGSAWARYSSIETNWMDLRTGQKSG